jgi:hypothetical protein
VETISEQEVGRCTLVTRRFWLMETGKPTPFLLTFESCKLPNYEEVEAVIEQRRKRFYEANPQVKKEFEKFCRENKIVNPKDQEILEVLSGFYEIEDLPVTASDPKLVKVELDKAVKSVRKR